MQRSHGIDILRAVAALSVLITHIGITDYPGIIGESIHDIIRLLNHNLIWVNGGLHGGVIIFVVVSGFCIHLGSKSLTNKNFLKIYIIRRFFRIYPLFIFALICGYATLLLTNGSSFNSNFFYLDILKNFLSSVFLLYSIIPVLPPLGNEILSTVIVECMLYSFYPLIISFLNNKWKLLIIILFFIQLFSFSLIFFTSLEPVWIQRNFFTVLIYWWLGAYAAELSLSRNKENIISNLLKISKKRQIFISFFLWIFYILFSNIINFQGSHIFKSLILAVLIAYSLIWIYSLESKESKNIVKNIFIYLGVISYSIYVLSLPVSYLVQYYLIEFNYYQYFYILSYAIIIIASYFCYTFIEKPTHIYGKNLTKNLF